MSSLPPEEQTAERKLRAASVFLAVIVVALFSPAFSSQFTNWDDPVLVTENPLIRSLSWTNIKAIFSFSSIQEFKHYIPLVLLSYSVEHAIAGLNPSIFHSTNVALHAINTILVLWLSFRLIGNVPAALIVALLFGIHPLRVESVAWITERKDMLSAGAYFGALLAYLSYIDNPRSRRFLLLTGVLFLLSLLSKAMAVSLPLVLILFDILKGREITRRVLLEKIPFFLLSIGFGVLALLSHTSASGTPLQQGVGGGVSFSFLERVMVAGYGVLFYIGRLFFPLDLSVLYQLPVSADGSFSALMLLSPLIVITALVFLVLIRKKVPLIVFGILFFLITLAPVSQLIPAGVAGVADRFTYIPFFGLFLALAYGTRQLYERFLISVPPIVPVLLIGLWMGALAFLTYNRTLVWKDSLTLWNSVLDSPPPHPPMAYVHRALAYAGMRRFEEASLDYTAALVLDSSLAIAWNNRGNIHTRLGRYESALKDYEKALEAYPLYTDALINRASNLILQERFAEALESCQKAVALDENNVLARFKRAQTYERLEDFSSAMTDYNATLRIAPGFAEAYLRRADLFFKSGDFQAALSDYNNAIRFGLSSPTAYLNRGSAYANLGFFDLAIIDFTKVLEVNPGSIEAFYNRGLAYLGKREYRTALQHFERLEKLGYRQDPQIMQFLNEHLRGQPR